MLLRYYKIILILMVGIFPSVLLAIEQPFYPIYYGTIYPKENQYRPCYKGHYNEYHNISEQRLSHLFSRRARDFYNSSDFEKWYPNKFERLEKRDIYYDYIMNNYKEPLTSYCSNLNKKLEESIEKYNKAINEAENIAINFIQTKNKFFEDENRNALKVLFNDLDHIERETNYRLNNILTTFSILLRRRVNQRENIDFYRRFYGDIELTIYNRDLDLFRKILDEYDQKGVCYKKKINPVNLCLPLKYAKKNNLSKDQLQLNVKEIDRLLMEAGKILIKIEELKGLDSTPNLSMTIKQIVLSLAEEKHEKEVRKAQIIDQQERKEKAIISKKRTENKIIRESALRENGYLPGQWFYATIKFISKNENLFPKKFDAAKVFGDINENLFKEYEHTEKEEFNPSDKDEFETTLEYEKRKKIEKENFHIEKSNALKKMESINIDNVRSEFLSTFGSFQMKNLEYDADAERYTWSLTSSKIGFISEFNLPMRRNKSKLFKENIDTYKHYLIVGFKDNILSLSHALIQDTRDGHVLLAHITENVLEAEIGLKYAREHVKIKANIRKKLLEKEKKERQERAKIERIREKELSQTHPFVLEIKCSVASQNSILSICLRKNGEINIKMKGEEISLSMLELLYEDIFKYDLREDFILSIKSGYDSPRFSKIQIHIYDRLSQKSISTKSISSGDHLVLRNP